MPFQTQTIDWPADRAVLLVHGVGNARPGDYDNLVAAVKAALGADANRFAIYALYYDMFNDWFTEKTALADKIGGALGFLKGKLDGSALADTMAEFAGDVLWPVFSMSARTVIREAYLAQLKQIVQDGIKAGHRAKAQKLSIICHSLGCFHTYEALHTAARFPTHGLQPMTDGVRFQNVVYMASPVQLIRSVAFGLPGLVPKRWLATLDDGGLAQPNETGMGRTVKSVKKWVSIAGELDPVGGHFQRRKAGWAYMTVDGQDSIIDSQSWLDLGDDTDLVAALKNAVRERAAPQIGINNPHSWEAYVNRHASYLHDWMVA
jgi:hypothetical protein